MKDECIWYLKFDGHYTPSCISDHGYRVNGAVKAETFKVCPYCEKQLKVVTPK